MRRREFILGVAMLANVRRVSAQGRARRVGALIAEPSAGDVLETSLREKGWILGQNLQIEYRITRGDTNLSKTYARYVESFSRPGGNVTGFTPFEPRGPAYTLIHPLYALRNNFLHIRACLAYLYSRSSYHSGRARYPGRDRNQNA